MAKRVRGASSVVRRGGGAAGVMAIVGALGALEACAAEPIATRDTSATPVAPPRDFGAGATSPGSGSDGGDGGASEGAGGTNAGGTNAGGTNAGGANAGGTNAGGTNAGGAAEDAELLVARDVVVGGEFLYLASAEGSLVRVGKTFASRAERFARVPFASLAISADAVFGVAEGALVRVARDGGQATTLATGVFFRPRVAGRSAYVLARTSPASCRLLAVSLSGGADTSVATGLSCDGDFAVDDAYAYVVRDGLALRVQLASLGASELGAVPELGDVFRMAQSASTLFFAAGAVPAVLALPKSGGEPSVLAREPSPPAALVASGGSLFWLRPSPASASGPRASVVGVATAGGAPTVLAPNLARPTSLAVDDDAVYVASDASSVARLPRASL